MILCFDMDGTLADLYKVKDWLPKLRAEDTSPYEEAELMWDSDSLIKAMTEHQKAGNRIAIITWLSKGGSKSYNKATAQAKREWLERHGIPFDNFHAVRYGATKADSVRKIVSKFQTEAILFDDNEKVRKGWHLGKTIDPNQVSVVEALQSLL